MSRSPERSDSSQIPRRSSRFSFEDEEHKSSYSNLEIMQARRLPVSQKITAFRQNLPAYQHRGEIIGAISQNQVVIISGDTGCGKSTQVTQYIYEHALETNTRVRIACTQPRRIAATSLAERVSEEVGCVVGSIVGYQIGLEKKSTPDTAITYLTPGVLLQQLMRRDGQNRYTHIIVDEAHERDIDTEFCLMLLRKIIAKTSTKLVIMSAMMDVQLFRTHFMLYERRKAQYALCDFRQQEQQRSAAPGSLFEPPLLHVGGKRFDVHENYLEEALSFVNKKFSDVYQHDQPDLIFSTSYPGLDLRSIDLGVELVRRLLAAQKEPICVLVFLPGMAEIEEMATRISCGHTAKSVIPLTVHRLHSSISITEQRQIFLEMPSHRVILASNIAESSITVPGVRVVINFGLEKAMTFDPTTNVEALKLTWISTASEIQRVGRAGRVCAGECFHIYPRNFARSLIRYAVPEIQRSSLEKILLMLLQMGEGRDLLDYGVQPPSVKNIERSIDNLLTAGLVVKNEFGKLLISPLGRFAVKLPLDYRVAKLVFFGIYLGVYPAAVHAAALFNVHDLLRKDSREIIFQRLAIDKLYSDVITLLRMPDAQSREIKALVAEVSSRIFHEQNDGRELYANVPIDTRQGELAFQLALFAAFYPSYFQTQCHDYRTAETVTVVCQKEGMDPWHVILFRNVPPGLSNENFLRQLKAYFFRLFSSQPIIKKVATTDYLRIVEFAKYRNDAEVSLEPWGLRFKNVYMALSYLSQKTFYCQATRAEVDGTGDERVSVRCSAYHPFAVSLVNFFTESMARIDGSSSLAALIMRQLPDGGIAEPDYPVVSGLISESNSGNTICRRLSMLPRNAAFSHLPILSLLFAPTPVVPFYNKAVTKVRSALFSFAPRPVVFGVYLDDVTLLTINTVRKDIRRFIFDFRIKGDYPAGCKVLNLLETLISATYHPMKKRALKDDYLGACEKQNLANLFNDHPFRDMGPLKIPDGLDLSEDEETEEASRRIDEFLHLQRLAKGWFPEKRLLCGECGREVCKLCNVQPPTRQFPAEVVGIMTCVFGLLKNGEDPRDGVCMDGHLVCRVIEGRFVLTAESNVRLSLETGEQRAWDESVYGNFFAGVGGTQTPVPAVLPGEKISYLCPLCNMHCDNGNEFTRHVTTPYHRSEESRWRSLFRKH